MRFVDLGLPSGTLWAERDVEEPTMSGCSLPSYEQAQELIECCDFCIRTTPEGAKSISVLGPSGRFIYFPLEEYEDTPGPSGCCWCAGGPSADMGYFMLLSEVTITIGVGRRDIGFPYRMVRAQ
ncbi:MAG: hypothetical protein IJT97_06220 [Bacteroidaceae bacterium]|nr:hypothetical protein [Bacteroidaceae bacterium]